MAFSVFRNCVTYSKALISNKSSICNSVSKSLFYAGQTSNATFARSLFYLHQRKYPINTLTSKINFSDRNNCFCSMHTKGDEELAAFLSEEIENEKKSQASPVLPKIEGFEVSFNGGIVELVKKVEGEKVVISANVSNSVDAEDTTMDPNETKEPQESEMKAKPDFRINITKHKKTLSFLCSYTTDVQEEDAEAYNDSFEITEVSMFEGEYDEELTYSVSGSIMDGYLYDLLMNFLEERGITNDMADKMVGLFTAYEHQLYINLLQDMKSWVKKTT